MTIPNKIFAATYGESAYGTNVYNANGTTGTTTDGGTLPATGTNMVVGLVGGILLIVVAVVLFISLRSKKNKKQ